MRVLVVGVGQWSESLQSPPAPGFPPAAAALSPCHVPLFAGLLPALAQFRQACQQQQATTSTTLARQSAALEALPDAVLWLDAARKIQYGNAAARQIWGNDLAERDLATVIRHPAVLEAVSTLLREDGVFQQTAETPAPGIPFSLASPVERILAVRVRPLPGGGVLLVFQDQTSQQRAEQMRADFIASVSHELRTPLSSLVGFVETLREAARDDAEARERFLGIMQGQTNRMIRLVEDLMALSKIELGEHHPPAGRVAIADCIDAVVATLEITAAARGLTIDVKIASPPPEVLGDEEQVIQVVQNLLSNALRYTRPNTTVCITAVPATEPPAGIRVIRDSPPAMLALSVQDQGEGIARIHLPRLTERFYRVDPARSRALGGTGLGLAIVKHIVNRHRGRLLIDSEPGRGSTFTVLLPLAPPLR